MLPDTLLRPSLAAHCTRHSHIAIANTGLKGRGIIATADIPAGTLLEESPVYVFSPEDFARIQKTALSNYVFRWDMDGQPRRYALCLGLISLVNYARRQPSAEIECDHNKGTIRLFSQMDIQTGGEITFDYDCELDFDPVEE